MRRWIVCVLMTACAATTARAQDAPPPPVSPAPRSEPARSVEPPDTPAGKVLTRVLAMFAGEPDSIKETDLSDGFKAQVPPAALRQITSQIRAAEGTLTLASIDEGAQERALVANVTGSKKGTAFKVRLVLDEQDKIAGLLLTPGTDARAPALKSWDDLKERLKGASEKTALTLREMVERRVEGEGAEGGRVVREVQSRVYLNSETPLAIGSAFKLWVLGALASAVEAGDLRWEDQMKVRDTLKSLPSGTMQDQRDGAEFTVRQFAEKMISISDNTATDHLIDRLGRDRCERFMARCAMGHSDLNAPFLTTRDLFALKLSGSDELPKKYASAGIPTRREMISAGGDVGTATPQVVLAAAWKAPRFVDSLEWFASGQDLATTMFLLDEQARTPGLEPVRAILSINPGIPIDRKVWSYVGFKGGSEPGVLSLTWLLERHDGKKYVLSITFNDTKKAIDESLALGLAQRAMEYLGGFDVREAK